nr:hypothetical protein CFP56_64391 [Quercus suber]
MKENVDLKSEVTALYEHMDKVKEEAIEEFQMSQPYFNKMGAAEPISNDGETDDEVLVFNGLGDVADDPKDPQEQANNPLTDP